MEQRASRARNAMLALAPAPVPSTDVGTQWSSAWNSDSAPPLPYETQSIEERLNQSRNTASPRESEPESDTYTESSNRRKRMESGDEEESHKRPRANETEPLEGSSFHSTTDGYAGAGLRRIPDLHPHLVASTPDSENQLALNESFDFPVSEAYNAQTHTDLAEVAAAAAAAMQSKPSTSKGVPRRLQQRSEDPITKLSASQEKVRAAFVSAHAGHTYEQMVLERAYSSDRLFWLKEAYGLSWRTGRWSQEEEDLATAAIEKFCKHYNLSSAALDELIWHRKPEQKHMHEELWKHIALSVGTRPNYAVRMHIKSMRKKVVRGGNWTPAEVEMLSAAVAELGHQWEKIGERLGRSGNVCKHYWREQVQGSQGSQPPQGAFTAEEEAELRRVVLECCAKVGCAPDGPNLPWTLIHERLGSSKRRISVLSRKWRGMLSAERRNSEDQNTRWYAPHDDHILLQRVRAQQKSNKADIDFDQLASDDWQWPTYVLKKHWTIMLRKRVPAQFHGSLNDLLDLLETRVPSPDQYKMLASGRRSNKTTELPT
ncbi:hypothetical protein MYAM1_001669 [Malassezia yamatoensis]|uniref:Uncharacterized protein n=1 Tax=Malassezia yamatoensis TaxID=253288 RepID=A0AAJ6CIJ4_9BASI|nr:hypothetical protein MYAM1_001669 [Malassezia yamatoensis]